MPVQWIMMIFRIIQRKWKWKTNSSARELLGQSREHKPSYCNKYLLRPISALFYIDCVYKTLQICQIPHFRWNKKWTDEKWKHHPSLFFFFLLFIMAGDENFSGKKMHKIRIKRIYLRRFVSYHYRFVTDLFVVENGRKWILLKMRCNEHNSKCDPLRIMSTCSANLFMCNFQVIYRLKTSVALFCSFFLSLSRVNEHLLEDWA